VTHHLKVRGHMRVARPIENIATLLSDSAIRNCLLIVPTRLLSRWDRSLSEDICDSRY